MCHCLTFAIDKVNNRLQSIESIDFIENRKKLIEEEIVTNRELSGYLSTFIEGILNFIGTKF